MQRWGCVEAEAGEELCYRKALPGPAEEAWPSQCWPRAGPLALRTKTTMAAALNHWGMVPCCELSITAREKQPYLSMHLSPILLPRARLQEADTVYYDHQPPCPRRPGTVFSIWMLTKYLAETEVDARTPLSLTFSN